MALRTRRVLWISAVFLLLVASVFYSYAQEQQQKPAEQWQGDGIAAALADALPSVKVLALQKIASFPELRGIRYSQIALASFPELRGIPSSQIAPFLKDPSADIRRTALSALGVIHAKEQAGEVVKLLKDPDDDVRQDAVSALGEMQAKEHAGEVAKLLKDPNEYVRSAAASALEEMQAKEHAEELAKRLKDSDASVRSDAVSELGEMQAKEHAGEVAELLKDPDKNVRLNAVSALDKMQVKEQAGEVAELLKDPDVDLRLNAVYALGEMQAKEQAGEVAKLLKDPYVNVRLDAVYALGKMQAKEYAGEVAKFLKDPGTDRAAVYALGRMQAKEQSGEVAKLLKDRDHDVRAFAVIALGRMHAKEQAGEVVKLLKDPDRFVRQDAVSALGEMQAKEQAGEVAKLLKDPGTYIRGDAAFALGEMQAKEQIIEISKLLKDPEDYVRDTAASALEKLAPYPPTILMSLSEAYYFDHAEQARVRFLCYYLTGGSRSVGRILQRAMLEPGLRDPKPFDSVEEAREALEAFREVLPRKFVDSGFATEADKQILQIAREWKTKWSPKDREFLLSLSRQMSDDSADVLQTMFEIPWWQRVSSTLWKIIGVQLVFWILLLYFYPRSTQVQAFFFWNRWARKFFGLGYVDLCLTWIPFLRNRLLTPFREELLADARVEDQSLNEYFEDIEVQEGEKTPVRLSEAIPEVKGQIVLEGESGLGKSTFLRRLVKNAKHPIAYLPAAGCNNGVFESIQLKLKGKASDETFLKSIIWSCGLRIVIDGLNEVSVETREKIRGFLSDFPKADVFLATQPVMWKRPPRARAFAVLSLSDDRILRFLESRYASFGPSVALNEDEYKQRCREYKEDVLGPQQSEEDRSAARLVLSNPMDLSTAAEILASGDRPTLKNLQEQQFRRVSKEFQAHAKQNFPLRQFSESIYERLLRDELSLDSGQFFQAIQAMAVHKMALVQNHEDADGNPRQKWVFRHDKIRDFFLVRAVLAQQNERIPKHLDDPRFRGVYLMLASQLPPEQAKALKDALVDRAAETRDHFLSDEVVKILKARTSSLLQSAQSQEQLEPIR